MTKHVVYRLTALAAFVSLAGLFAPNAAHAQEWGTLTGRFVFKGTPPKLPPLVINKDIALCKKHAPKNEALVIGEGGSVKDVVLFIRADTGNGKEGVAVSPIHPSYAATAKAEVVLDNKGCRFAPHVVLLRTTQTLVVTNSDPTGHNTSYIGLNNPAFNLQIPAGGKIEQKLPAAERILANVNCGAHPWMSGHLVVRPDPYMAATAADGTFAIKNIPAGKHAFQFSHGKLGYLRTVTIGGKTLKDIKGLHELEIKPGENNLGDIVIDAADYKRQIALLSQ